MFKARMRAWFKYVQEKKTMPWVASMFAVFGFAFFSQGFWIGFVAVILLALVGAGLNALPYWLWIVPHDIKIEQDIQAELDEFARAIADVRALLARIPGGAPRPGRLVDECEAKLKQIPPKSSDIGAWVKASYELAYWGHQYWDLEWALEQVKEAIDPTWKKDYNQRCHKQRFESLLKDLTQMNSLEAARGKLTEEEDDSTGK